MDIIRYIFPFIMAVLTNSVMIVAIFFLRKNRYFANLFGIEFMVVLYLFCLLRIFVPIEFPDVQIILRDRVLFADFVDTVIFRTDAGFQQNLIFLIAFLGIWISVSVYFTVRFFIKDIDNSRRYLSISNIADEHDRAILRKAELEIFGKERNITIIKSKWFYTVFTFGYFKKYIAVPKTDLDDESYCLILKHECTHIKNHDNWLKLLVEIYCFIFWWNPASYLLRSDMEWTLELKCDLSVTKGFSLNERENYVLLIGKFSDEQHGMSNMLSYTNSAFAKEVRKGYRRHELRRRIDVVLSDPPKKAKQIPGIIAVGICFFVIFIASYIFIWQPIFDYPEVEDYRLSQDGIISDETNSYLVEQEDGSYIFYFENMDPILVTKEEYEKGLFRQYPIIVY